MNILNKIPIVKVALDSNSLRDFGNKYWKGYNGEPGLKQNLQHGAFLPKTPMEAISFLPMGRLTGSFRDMKAAHFKSLGGQRALNALAKQGEIAQSIRQFQNDIDSYSDIIRRQYAKNARIQARKEYIKRMKEANNSPYNPFR